MANENEAEVKVAAADKQNLLILNPEDAETIGLATISQNTIARIVTKAAMEVEGVARFAPKGAGDLLSFFSGKAYDSSMVIEFQEGKINLNLALFLYFGCVVPQVVKNVRGTITEQIQQFIGAPVGKINILVKDLIEPEPVPETPVEEAAPAEEKAVVPEA